MTFNPTPEQIEAAARVLYDGFTGLVTDAWEVEHEDEKSYWTGQARAALVTAQGVAPVLPSSTVDEGKIAEELRRHKLVHVSVSRKSAFCSCNPSVTAGVDDNLGWFAKHRARAVAEWFKEQ